MNPPNLPFKIYTTYSKKRKTVILIDHLDKMRPPENLRVGIYKDRAKAYVEYLVALYKQEDKKFFDQLLLVYRVAVDAGEITLGDSRGSEWVKEGFKDFLIQVSEALGMVTGQRVDLDKPFA